MLVEHSGSQTIPCLRCCLQLGGCRKVSSECESESPGMQAEMHLLGPVSDHPVRATGTSLLPGHLPGRSRQPDTHFPMTAIIIYMQGFMIRNWLLRAIKTAPSSFHHLSNNWAPASYFDKCWKWPWGIQDSVLASIPVSVEPWDLRTMEMPGVWEGSWAWEQMSSGSPSLTLTWAVLCYILNVFPYMSPSAKDIFLSLKKK